MPRRARRAQRAPCFWCGAPTSHFAGTYPGRLYHHGSGRCLAR